MPLAYNLEIWHEAALLELRDRYHSDFEYFLYDSGYSKCRNLNLPSMLHKVVKVVNIANLTRDCDTLGILGSYLTVVD